MEKKLSILVCLLLFAVSGHGLRILHDVDGDFGQGFAFGSRPPPPTRRSRWTRCWTTTRTRSATWSSSRFDAGSTPYAAGDADAAAPAPGPAAEAGSAARQRQHEVVAAAVDDPVVPAVPRDARARHASPRDPIQAHRLGLAGGARPVRAGSPRRRRRRRRRGPERRQPSHQLSQYR
ncbi:hypothetical protein OsJ_12821 [Oryza sativa Japonica Group]|uniref:Uncharacterized protein n=1 Tax=Oryza sativa subsp. japonica TaxID=39947 RepID=A3ANA7_ORYSJ|nr:hypothetical protein OsJ_12821 [Oryza sativa Japonica Group]